MSILELPYGSFLDATQNQDEVDKREKWRDLAKEKDIRNELNSEV